MDIIIIIIIIIIVVVVVVVIIIVFVVVMREYDKNWGGTAYIFDCLTQWNIIQFLPSVIATDAFFRGRLTEETCNTD